MREALLKQALNAQSGEQKLRAIKTIEFNASQAAAAQDTSIGAY